MRSETEGKPANFFPLSAEPLHLLRHGVSEKSFNYFQPLTLFMSMQSQLKGSKKMYTVYYSGQDVSIFCHFFVVPFNANPVASI